MARHRQKHISGWPAILLAPLIIPVVLLIKLAERLFSLHASADLTPHDVESYLSNFLDGGGSEWDWDDFTSIPITDPTLERIRHEALFVLPPLTDEGETTLRRLLEQVRAM